MKIALAQINPRVGSLSYNLHLIGKMYRQAVRAQADLMVCPEMSLSGYPAEDLAGHPFFLKRVRTILQRLTPITARTSTALLLGAPWEEDGHVFNAAVCLHQGCMDLRYKTRLPHTGVFDEKRVFTKGSNQAPLLLNTRDGLCSLAVLVCEDMWSPDVVAPLVKQGAHLILVLNASPFEVNKAEERKKEAQKRVQETGHPLLYLNCWGGQDHLVFDGGSFGINPDGSTAFHLKPFAQDFYIAHCSKKGGLCVQPPCPTYKGLASCYRAVLLGVRDYAHKNGFEDVLIGLSGGLDSALTAALAVDALGAEHVRCVMIPSPYTSQESREDAALLASLLGVTLTTLPLTPLMSTLTSLIKEAQEGLAHENMQARLRSVLLMTLSNTTGALLLCTSNKSEAAMGYTTLYGDMCGGYAPLIDLYKTDVQRLASWRNTHAPLSCQGGLRMPERVLSKAPSAELRLHQKDTDSLPPYEILDALLRFFMEGGKRPEGEPALFSNIWTRLMKAQYKRFQAPPGPKVSSCSLGLEWRYPLTNGFYHD